MCQQPLLGTHESAMGCFLLAGTALMTDAGETSEHNSCKGMAACFDMDPQLPIMHPAHINGP